jgi:hypothetical protein
MRPHTLHRHLRKAREACKLSALTWYQATRHTFASQWVLNNGSMEKLSLILGHSSVWVTQRYAHLRPDLFRETDYRMLDIDLTAPAQALELTARQPSAGAVGYALATQAATLHPAATVTR